MIYHWLPAHDWDGAAEQVVAPSLALEGFIHCSFLHQVERTATSVDKGREDLVLLVIDETDLPLAVEDCYELGEEYPHIYGPIPISAVTAVMPFPPSDDGSFQLPDGLAT